MTLEEIEKDPVKIPYLLRNEVISMFLQAWQTLEIATNREFK